MDAERNLDAPAGWSFDGLFASLESDRDRTALLSVGSDGMEELSRGALLDRAEGLAAGLAAAGLAPGEAVALVAPNGPDWIACWLGLAHAGAVIAAFDDLTPADELAAAVAACGCRFALAAPAHLAVLAEGAEEGAFRLFALAPPAGHDLPAGVRSWESLLGGPASPPALGANAPAVMVHTSGTTGAPKRFVLTRGHIAANVGALLAAGLLGERDRVLMPLPLHHVYPLIVGMLTPLAAGAALVLPAAVTGAEIGRALALSRAAAMIGVPRLYDAIASGIEARAGASAVGRFLFKRLAGLALAVRRRLGLNPGRVLFAPLHRRLGGRLRLLVSGGARMEPAVFERLEALGFDVLSGYGLAETASIFTGNLPWSKRPGSEGRPLAGGAVRIAGAGADGIGEIQLTGPNVFAGYLDDPGLNAQAFTEDGWFRTGDLGRLDRDGFLHVTGRAKELIVLGGGKNIDPEAVERRLAAAPAVAEAAVLEREGRLVALVRPDLARLRAEGKTRPEDAIRVALRDAARGLPSYAHPSGFALVRAPLPRTRLGKLRRFLLPELYEDALRGRTAPPAPLSPEDRALVAEPPGSRIWALLEARYAARGLAMDASPELDLGIDSLEWMTLALELEGRLGIRLDRPAVGRILTVRDLVREAIAAAGAPGTAVEAEDGTAWIAPPGAALRVAGTVLFAVNKALARVLFRLRVEGRAHLPEGGRPMVLVANHASDLDAPFLVAALPYGIARRLWWGGDTTRLFRGPLARTFGRIAHIFPVDEHAPAHTLGLARRVLDRGDSLGWFPEAWRTPDGALQRFLPGIGMLLEGRDVDVVPAYIEGSFEVMPRGARRPRFRPVRVRFGAPARPQALAAEGAGGSTAERIAAALERRVAALAEGGGGSADVRPPAGTD